jgi:hypothetical protein
MDRDLSNQLTGRMAIVPHETVTGVECGGCIVAAVEGTNVELRCNECGAVVGVVRLEILKGLLRRGNVSPLRRAEYLSRFHRDLDLHLPRVRKAGRDPCGARGHQR